MQMAQCAPVAQRCSFPIVGIRPPRPDGPETAIRSPRLISRTGPGQDRDPHPIGATPAAPDPTVPLNRASLTAARPLCCPVPPLPATPPPPLLVTVEVAAVQSWTRAPLLSGGGRRRRPYLGGSGRRERAAPAAVDGWRWAEWAGAVAEQGAGPCRHAHSAPSKVEGGGGRRPGTGDGGGGSGGCCGRRGGGGGGRSCRGHRVGCGDGDTPGHSTGWRRRCRQVGAGVAPSAGYLPSLKPWGQGLGTGGLGGTPVRVAVAAYTHHAHPPTATASTSCARWLPQSSSVALPSGG